MTPPSVANMKRLGPDTPPLADDEVVGAAEHDAGRFAAGRRIGLGNLHDQRLHVAIAVVQRGDVAVGIGDPDETERIERHAPGVDEVGIDMRGGDAAVGHQVALLEAQAAGGLGGGGSGQRQGECEWNAKLL